MRVKMILNAENMTKADLRTFIQKIREWELMTPRSQIVGILFYTDPQMSSQEEADIFRGIFPEFKHLVEIPGPVKPEEGLHVTVAPDEGSILRLGSRGIVVEGELIATIEEMTLTICEADEEALKKLREAREIHLVRVRKG